MNMAKGAKRVSPADFMPLADGPLAPPAKTPPKPGKRIANESGLRALIDGQVKAAVRAKRAKKLEG